MTQWLASRTLRRDGPRGAATGLVRPPRRARFGRVGAECLVRPSLPARSGRPIRGDDIAIDAQADHFFGWRLLRTALATIPTDRFHHFVWQHFQQRASRADLLGCPLGVFGVRPTGVLSHRSVPLARSLAED